VAIGVGVIGIGSLGGDHARRLAADVRCAEIRAVFDVDAQRARALGEELGAEALATARELIRYPGVDAVLIASPGATHASLSLDCIAAGIPALCEKPLAPTTKECLQVVGAEVARHERLVQVGFMRRYDPGYIALRQALAGDEIGSTLLMHCVHRNLSVASTHSSDMSLTDTAIHEIDICRWLTGEEIVDVTVTQPRKSAIAAVGLRDPLLVTLETESGIVMTVEVFVNCQYGYDVRCEVVGSTGVATLSAPSSGVSLRPGSRRPPVRDGWKVRFEAAYLEELQSWIDGLCAGTVAGPSAWDGYVATAVAQCCVRSLDTGTTTPVVLDERPALYG
jgi:myo-inositol 2-dehydrogenase/D-chiro-inositol 1-dehydrogenase